VNITCSNRWAKPVRPTSSFFDPTWYIISTDTVGVAWSSASTTVRPFESVYFLERDVERGRRRGLPGARRERREGSDHSDRQEQKEERTDSSCHEGLLHRGQTLLRQRRLLNSV
jgi:hypothetical protein